MDLAISRINQLIVDSLEEAKYAYSVVKSVILFRKMMSEAFEKVVPKKKGNYIERRIRNIKKLLHLMNIDHLLDAAQVGNWINVHDRMMVARLKKNDDLRRRLEQSAELRFKYWDKLSQPAFFRQIIKAHIKLSFLTPEEEKMAMARLDSITEQIFQNR